MKGELSSSGRDVISRKLSLANRYGEILRLTHFIEEIGHDVGWTQETTFSIVLCLEELVTNTMKYGYPDGATRPVPEIRLQLEVHPSIVELLLEDNGQAFNPLLHYEQIDTSAPLEARHEGGLGIFLVMQKIDSVSYSRVDGWNRLLMKKSVTS